MKLVVIFQALVFTLTGMVASAQTGKLSGKILSHSNLEPIPFATIVVSDSTGQIAGTTADFDGKYRFDSLPVGKFSIKVNFVGFEPLHISDVIIKNGSTCLLDIRMYESFVMIETFEVTGYKIPLIDKDRTSSGHTVASSSSSSSTRNANPGTSGYLSQSQGNAFYTKDISGEIKPGQLTASELNDFSKWNLWEDIRKLDLNEFQKLWRVIPDQRYVVQLISNDNKPIVDVMVTLTDQDNRVLWKARTDNTGKAELWDGMFGRTVSKKLKISAISNGEMYTIQKPRLIRNGINVMKIPVECMIPEKVDIAFVVDATGSMNDEIAYLKSELVDIIQSSETSLPGIALLTGSVFYRCFGNSYVTRIQPFHSDLKQTEDFIKMQYTGEGGDEAVEEALRVATDSLKWDETARARLLFFILDEQPLTNPEVLKKLHASILNAAAKGIRIIPVIASAETPRNARSMEYLMRSIALATNGTYLFLTDHSEIGETHSKPVTDSYNVEMLNNLMKRIIYQFSYVPDCDTAFSTESISDTTFVFNSPVIAVELIDPARSVKEVQPDLILNDYTKKPVQDTVDVDVTDDLKSNSDSITDQMRNTEKTGIRYFPNPTAGVITIEITGTISALLLTDISGKLLATFNLKGETGFRIDFGKYCNGLYLLKFFDGSQWFSGKVIVRH